MKSRNPLGTFNISVGWLIRGGNWNNAANTGLFASNWNANSLTNQNINVSVRWYMQYILLRDICFLKVQSFFKVCI